MPWALTLPGAGLALGCASLTHKSAMLLPESQDLAVCGPVTSPKPVLELSQLPGGADRGRPSSFSVQHSCMSSQRSSRRDRQATETPTIAGVPSPGAWHFCESSAGSSAGWHGILTASPLISRITAAARGGYGKECSQQAKPLPRSSTPFGSSELHAVCR